jgi:hypothetical protein
MNLPRYVACACAPQLGKGTVRNIVTMSLGTDPTLISAWSRNPYYHNHST